MSKFGVTGLGRSGRRTNIANSPAPACTLDVRTLPRPQRHAVIFERFDRLAEGESLLLETDHEPRPLRAEFEQRRLGLFAWEHRRLADLHWQAVIRKLPAGDLRDPWTILQHCPLFAAAGEACFDGLLGRARLVRIKQHRAIVEQGICWPYVGVVAAGRVQAVLVTPGGRELGMYDVLAGEVFGVIPLVDGGSSPLRYVARSKTTDVLLLPLDAVAQVMREIPSLARAIHTQNVRRFRSLLERFASHAGQPIVARVAEELLAYAAPRPGLTDALPPLPEIRQVELAVSAGTAKDMVYRAIAELEQAGALALKNTRIVRLDRAKLTRFSEMVKY